MDAVDDDGYIVNPSSLHALLHRRPARPLDGADDERSSLTHGVDRQAVRLDGSHSFVDIDTSALKMECFGDLYKCRMGKYPVPNNVSKLYPVKNVPRPADVLRGGRESGFKPP